MPITKGDHSYIIGAIYNECDIQVTFGKFCSVALGLEIFPGNHAPIPHPECVASYPFDSLMRLLYPSGTAGEPVIIGNDVWIGRRVTLRTGIKIGDGAIIGTNSVVTKDVKPYEIVAGNPAKHIRFRFTEEQIKKLEEIKWWDWPLEQIKQRIHLIADVNKLIKWCDKVKEDIGEVK